MKSVLSDNCILYRPVRPAKQLIAHCIAAILICAANLTVQGNLLGSVNGRGFGWQDVTVVKLGVSYVYAPDLTVRAGYNHSGQAVPNSQTFFNILAPGVVQDHLTLGATWATSKNGELSAAYTHGFKKTVNGANSIPAAFGGGNAYISLQENIFGVAYGWKY